MLLEGNRLLEKLGGADFCPGMIGRFRAAVSLL